MGVSRRVMGLFVLACLVPLTGQAQTDAEVIALAIRPLPDDLQAGATVFRYNPETGERIVLRKGDNHVECQPKDEEGFTRCTPVVEGPRRDLQARLRAQGLSSEEVSAEVARAETAGQIQPRTFGAMSYRLYDEDDRIRLLWIISVPNATATQMGYPLGAQRNNALEGRGTPWMMNEGTPGAHLMIPINGTPLSNAGAHP